MLDIKIKELSKALNTAQKRQKFMTQNVRIEEKFDGTKLTLIRNDRAFDPNNYAKNWIVAYKGNVLYPEEYVGLASRDDEIRRCSIGTSQYKLVHDLLRSRQKLLGKIPTNYEFLVEFIQNKPTLTRDYREMHGLYLIDTCPASPVAVDQRVYTVTSPSHRDTRALETHAKVIGLRRPPVLFEGNMRELGDNVGHIVARYSDFESTLGGRAEGVVITTKGRSSDTYKIVAPDQYDRDVRSARKSRWTLPAEGESVYWDRVYAQARDVIEQSSSKNLRDTLSALSTLIYGMRQENLRGQNRKKSLITLQDDLFLTAKLRLERTSRLTSECDRIGLCVIAGKPIHNGHWNLIENCSRDCDIAYLYVSTADRDVITGESMMRVWRDFLIRHLPKNVVLRFDESPVTAMKREVKSLSLDFNARRPKFSVYVGDDDVSEWSPETLRKSFPDLYSFDRISVETVNRSATYGVSGTQMRAWLKDGSEKSKVNFCDNLPYVLLIDEREAIWEALRA